MNIPMSIPVKKVDIAKPPPRWYEVLLDYKVLFVGAGFLVAGVVLFLLATQRPKDDRTFEYLKDSAFHLATAGLVIMLADLLLRKETNNFVGDSIRRTISERFEDIEFIRHAVAQKSIHDVLVVRMRWGRDGKHQLPEDLTALIENLDNLMHHKAWARDVYLQYLAEVIHSARVNAEEFCDLTDETRSDDFPRPIKLASPAERTDKILSGLMNLLPKGSKYDVISDIRSWQDGKLDDFSKASREAVARGVNIRRIFVVSWGELRNGLVSAQEAHDIIARHLDDAEKASGDDAKYEVRLLDTMVATTHRTASEFAKQHFGIFSPPHTAGQPCLQVTVDHADFSRLSLRSIAQHSDDAQDFGEVWEILGEELKVHSENKVLTNELLGQAAARWETVRG
jgi:hypothetical protein